MATYIALINWTEQGIKNVKDSPKRLDDVRQAAEGMGCRVGDVYMTIGPHDLVAIVEAPDDTTLAKLILRIGASGSVRTTTMKAFAENEYREITGSV